MHRRKTQNIGLSVVQILLKTRECGAFKYSPWLARDKWSCPSVGNPGPRVCNIPDAGTIETFCRDCIHAIDLWY